MFTNHYVWSEKWLKNEGKTEMKKRIETWNTNVKAREKYFIIMWQWWSSVQRDQPFIVTFTHCGIGNYFVKHINVNAATRCLSIFWQVKLVMNTYMAYETRINKTQYNIHNKISCINYLMHTHKYIHAVHATKITWPHWNTYSILHMIMSITMPNCPNVTVLKVQLLFP